MNKPPRQVITWDDYYMQMAYTAALRSKDPDTQMGAVVVNLKTHQLGIGMNGGSRMIADGAVDWSRPNKYDWVIHAEENAIYRAGQWPLDGWTLYVTGKPCARCMLRISHAGIYTIVYGSTKWQQTELDSARSMAIYANSNMRMREWEDRRFDAS